MERLREPAGLDKAVFQHCACTAIAFNHWQFFNMLVQRSTVLIPHSATSFLILHSQKRGASLVFSRPPQQSSINKESFMEQHSVYE